MPHGDKISKTNLPSDVQFTTPCGSVISVDMELAGTAKSDVACFKIADIVSIGKKASS